MQAVLSPLVNVYQTQLEASRRFADAIFTGTEKIDRVVIDSVHRIFNQQLNFAQAMTSVRDPQSAASTLQSNFLARNPEYTMNTQREIMQIFAEMQNELGKSLHDYIEQLGTNAANAANGAAAPVERAHRPASGTGYNPMTSMFSVWESAFREVAALTSKNMATARSTIEDAANRTIDRAASFTTSAAEDAAALASRAADSASMAARSTLGGEAEHGGGDRRGTTGSGKRK